MDDVIKVRLLLRRKADPNNHGNTADGPLLLAARGRHPEVLQLLLAHGADPCGRGGGGACPLRAAIDPIVDNNGDSLGVVVQKRRAAGSAAAAAAAAAAAGNSSTATSTTASIADSCMLLAKVLLAQRADANSKDNDGRTPLYVAARCGALPIARLLLDSDADPSVAGYVTNSPHPLRFLLTREH